MNNFEKKPIAIIGAMDIEVQTLIGLMENRTQAVYGGLEFHEGAIEGVACVVARCGAGKVNAAVCAQTMILKYSPRLVINLGVAGGTGGNVKIGDLVVASSCVQYDYNTTGIGEPLGAVSIISMQSGTELVKEFPCDKQAASTLLEAAATIYGGAHSGLIATGDTFVSDRDTNAFIKESFSALAVEMEGGSIAQVCYMSRVPCGVIRAISDNADDDAGVDFPSFASSSAEKSAELLRCTINKL